MKKIFLLSICAMCLCLGLIGQNAEISNDFVISLNEDDALSSEYTVDISALEFESTEQTQKFFLSQSDNILSFEVSNEGTELILILYTDRTDGNWDVADWNTYLTQKATQLKNSYTRL